MALVLSDRVKETTATTGTATYTLAGAVNGFETFASVGDGNTTYYACVDGTDFEVGIGTFTASGTTLARTTILQSSNSDAAVSWGSGTKTIFCTQPAEKAVFLDASGDVAISRDTDASAEIGRAHIGNMGFSNLAGFSHVDQNSTTGYALLQNASGSTFLNSPSGQFVSFLINNSNTVYVSSSGLTLNTGKTLKFEGATADNFETTLTVEDPTVSDKTITLPNATGTILLTDGDGSSLTNVNATTLDSLDSNQFLRSDAADTKTSGDLTFSDDVQLRAGDGGDLRLYHDGANSYIDQTDATLFIRNTSETANASGTAIDIRNADDTGIEIPNNSGVTIKRNGITSVSFTAVGAYFSTDIVLNGSTRELKFRDTTAGDFDLILDAAQITNSDKTITLPNVTGTVLTTANSDTPTTTTSSSDADFVLIDDGGTMKKITPANLGVGSGGGGGSGISAGKSIIFSMVFG